MSEATVLYVVIIAAVVVLVLLSVCVWVIRTKRSNVDRPQKPAVWLVRTLNDDGMAPPGQATHLHRSQVKRKSSLGESSHFSPSSSTASLADHGDRPVDLSGTSGTRGITPASSTSHLSLIGLDTARQAQGNTATPGDGKTLRRDARPQTARRASTGSIVSAASTTSADSDVDTLPRNAVAVSSIRSHSRPGSQRAAGPSKRRSSSGDVPLGTSATLRRPSTDKQPKRRPLRRSVSGSSLAEAGTDPSTRGAASTKGAQRSPRRGSADSPAGKKVRRPSGGPAAAPQFPRTQSAKAATGTRRRSGDESAKEPTQKAASSSGERVEARAKGRSHTGSQPTRREDFKEPPTMATTRGWPDPDSSMCGFDEVSIVSADSSLVTDSDVGTLPRNAVAVSSIRSRNHSSSQRSADPSKLRTSATLRRPSTDDQPKRDPLRRSASGSSLGGADLPADEKVRRPSGGPAAAPQFPRSPSTKAATGTRRSKSRSDKGPQPRPVSDDSWMRGFDDADSSSLRSASSKGSTRQKKEKAQRITSSSGENAKSRPKSQSHKGPQPTRRDKSQKTTTAAATSKERPVTNASIHGFDDVDGGSIRSASSRGSARHGGSRRGTSGTGAGHRRHLSSSSIGSVGTEYGFELGRTGPGPSFGEERPDPKGVKQDQGAASGLASELAEYSANQNTERRSRRKKRGGHSQSITRQADASPSSPSIVRAAND